MSVKSGNGATLAFQPADVGETALTAVVVSIDGLEESIEALVDSDLSTTNTHTYCAADLREIAPFNVVLRWENDDVPLIGTLQTLITLTYPLETGESTAATLTGSGFITSRTSPTLENNVIAEGAMTIQFDGKATEPTYTPGS